MIINEEFRTRERMNVVAGSARVEGQLACMAADFRDPHKFDAVDLFECAFHFAQRNLLAHSAFILRLFVRCIYSPALTLLYRIITSYRITYLNIHNEVRIVKPINAAKEDQDNVFTRLLISDLISYNFALILTQRESVRRSVGWLEDT